MSPVPPAALTGLSAPSSAAARCLGVLGGMSWESTLVYYRELNRGVAAARGGLHSAPLLMASVDFGDIAARQRRGDWDGAAAVLGQAGAGLRQAGAGALMIATNTMHKVADAVTRRAGLPLLHIGDAVGAALAAAGHRRVGLLGTRFTMEDGFLHRHLAEGFGLEVQVPDAEGREAVHRLIFEELCRGHVGYAGRALLEAQVRRLADAGAQAVILGCTELSLSLPADAPGLPVPLADSTALHVAMGLRWLLGDDAEDRAVSAAQNRASLPATRAGGAAVTAATP
jgi:aspartate racemase